MTRTEQQILTSIRRLRAVDGQPVRIGHIQRQMAGTEYGPGRSGVGLWRVLRRFEAERRVLRVPVEGGCGVGAGWGWILPRRL
jgi:hypothetical protein